LIERRRSIVPRRLKFLSVLVLIAFAVAHAVGLLKLQAARQDRTDAPAVITHRGD
jgi:hypothetical protein